VSVSHVGGPTYGTLANVLYILPCSVNLCFSETENRIMVGGAYNSIIVCVCVTVDRETCSKRCDLQEL
jgi:hypothetical protein